MHSEYFADIPLPKNLLAYGLEETIKKGKDQEERVNMC